MDAISRAIEVFGSQAAMAAALGVRQPTVSEWLRGERPVPEERCVAIERATEGKVTCEELRPDVTWHRVPDPAWPWHPKGKPLVDVLPLEPQESPSVTPDAESRPADAKRAKQATPQPREQEAEPSEAPAAVGGQSEAELRRRAVDKAPDVFTRRNIEQAELIDLANKGLPNRRKPSREGPGARDERHRSGHAQNRREPHPR